MRRATPRAHSGPWPSALAGARPSAQWSHQSKESVLQPIRPGISRKGQPGGVPPPPPLSTATLSVRPALLLLAVGLGGAGRG